MKRALQLVKETFRQWINDNTFQIGAALAYYAVFSIAPILMIAIALSGAIFGEAAAQGYITAQIKGTVGPGVAQALEDIIANTAETGSGVLATVVGIVLLLLSASAVFGQLQQALNTVWKVPAKPIAGWWAAIKERFWSFTLVLGIGFLLLVSLVLSTALSAIAAFLTPASLPGGVFVWQAFDWLFSFAFITLLFALIYKLLPDVTMAWRDVWVGAAVTALLFSIGKYLIGLYLANSAWISAYGAAGSLVVILLWVFYSSQIFLLGAEFTQVYANQYGRLLEADQRQPVSQAASMRRTVTQPKQLGATHSR